MWDFKVENFYRSFNIPFITQYCIDHSIFHLLLSIVSIIQYSIYYTVLYRSFSIQFITQYCIDDSVFHLLLSIESFIQYSIYHSVLYRSFSTVNRLCVRSNESNFIGFMITVSRLIFVIVLPLHKQTILLQTINDIFGGSVYGSK